MAETRFYFDFHFPLKVVAFILSLIFGGKSGVNPETVDPGVREWFSQPRPGTDTGTEVITTTFKLPLSISELTLDILRVPCTVEVWYQDRSNNWRPVLDMTRIPLRVSVSYSDAKSFYKYSTRVYPIVAKQLRFQITRNNDPALKGMPYVVGLRNTLIRRNVYDRSQGQQYFEDEQDILGNVISKYIKDWDATRAVDDNPYTFWKSAPMPDPAAVASVYLDLRATDGGPKTVDKVYIDPVYTGSHLNLYYSSDDSVGTCKLNPITIRPDEDDNTEWRINRGRSDVAVGAAHSAYRWSMAVGPQVRRAAWIGVEWTPDFEPGDGPPQNPVLYRAMNPDGTFKPTIEYDVGAGEFTLRFDDGTETRTYNVALDTAFTPGDPLRIVAGWRYNPDTVYLSVVDRRGEEIAHLEDDDVLTLPPQISLDGQSEIFAFRGLITNMIVKLENYVTSSTAFQNSATYYVDPDPVIPDATGAIPSTTLDNAIYAVSWTTQEHGSGGAHVTAFEDKEWTPIWRNYVAEKGMLFFPQALSMKYLKMEFTNLTEQPYPVYESGIEVRYKVFPVSVIQQSTQGPRLYTGEGGFLGLGTFISLNGVRSVNWLNPFSVLSAVGSVLGPQYQPVQINQSSGYVSETLPNTGGVITDASETYRLELGSSYVYRRETLQPFILSETEYVTIIKAEGLQKIAEFTDVPWQDIEAANPGAITHVRSTGALPVRGTDWWIYPGQTLKIPANVMLKLTATSTVTERKLTLEHRVRFNHTSIHRYEYRTLKRDAAIAYFAGLREVIPFTSTFIDGEDKPFFDFPTYDPDQFVLNHTRAIEGGPITTQRKLYPIENRLFERNLNFWNADDADTWVWDGTTGRWLRGTAKATADQLDHELVSESTPIGQGEEIDFSVQVKWEDLVVTADDDVVAELIIRYYLNGTLTEDEVLGQVSYADWSAAANSVDTPEGEDTLGWIELAGSVITPPGSNGFRVVLAVTNKAESGTIWFESVKADSTDDTQGTAFKALQTMSTFAKVAVDFKDSGLWRGDAMWADAQEDTDSIEDTALAYYTRTIPETIPGGKWSDTIKGWGGDDIEWGSPFGVVSVTIDGTLRRDGKRVLHFHRASGAGEAGIKVKQWTHFVPLGLFRIGAVFYKPFANDNQATVRLRRLSDGVIVYEETVDAPAGRWHEFTTKFVEIPDSPEQEYDVMLTLEGDDEDELYLSDLYTEIANVRYFVKLGGIGAYLHEVTDLRYSDNRVYVTTTVPVNEMSVQAAILSPEAWAYGVRLSPSYLK